MENHHFQWVNPLFLWPFSIAILTQPEGRPGTIFDQFFPGFVPFEHCEVLTALVIPRLRTAAALGGIFDAESCDAWRLGGLLSS